MGCWGRPPHPGTRSHRLSPLPSPGGALVRFLLFSTTIQSMLVTPDPVPLEIVSAEPRLPAMCSFPFCIWGLQSPHRSQSRWFDSRSQCHVGVRFFFPALMFLVFVSSFLACLISAKPISQFASFHSRPPAFAWSPINKAVQLLFLRFTYRSKWVFQ